MCVWGVLLRKTAKSSKELSDSKVQSLGHPDPWIRGSGDLLPIARLHPFLSQVLLTTESISGALFQTPFSCRAGLGQSSFVRESGSVCFTDTFS